MTRTAAVTGATGFVGRAVCARLLKGGWRVVALVRSAGAEAPPGTEPRIVGDLAETAASLGPALAGVDAVVHLAARVHVMRPTPADEAAFHAVNVTATRALAEAAAAAGVSRFLFMSSIKVNGEGGPNSYAEADPPAPADAYGRSKAAAEEALGAVAAETGLGLTILRPPVVYGPGVGANVAALQRLCATGLPLPFGATDNARSLIAVENLADTVAACLERPEAAGKTYLVRDGEDLSTGDLVRLIRRAQGRPARLVPVPPGLLRAGLRLLGKGPLADRLLGSLRIDDGAIRRDLGWTPPLAPAEGLRRMVRGPEAGRGRLLFLITEDWYFWSHRVALARAARDAGWEVHVAARVTAHGERIAAEGFRLHPLRLDRSGRDPLAELAAIAEIRRVYKAVRPDVVHQVALKPVLYGTIAARLAGVPAVVNAMAGMGSLFAARKGRLRLIRPLVLAAFRLLLDRRNQRLVVQNEGDAALFRDRGIVRPERLVLIPGSGVDTGLFSPCPEPPAPPVVATVVGRILWDKGMAETVEAARLLKARGAPVTVRLVGAPDPHNPTTVPPETVAGWAAEGLVRWEGPSTDIPAVWADSHVAVLASYSEGLPRSLLEAAARARPLVATDIPGCRGLVEDGVTGLTVPVRDAVALADAIERLAADPALRARLGAAARARVAAEFSDAVILRQFLALYDSVSAASH